MSKVSSTMQVKQKSPYFLFHEETALRKILKFQEETTNFSEKFQGEIAEFLRENMEIHRQNPNPSHAVCDLARDSIHCGCCSPHLSFPWGTQGTTHRRHANNEACEIDNFIGCEGDFSI